MLQQKPANKSEFAVKVEWIARCQLVMHLFCVCTCSCTPFNHSTVSAKRLHTLGRFSLKFSLHKQKLVARLFPHKMIFAEIKIQIAFTNRLVAFNGDQQAVDSRQRNAKSEIQTKRKFTITTASRGDRAPKRVRNKLFENAGIMFNRTLARLARDLHAKDQLIRLTRSPACRPPANATAQLQSSSIVSLLQGSQQFVSN